MTTSETATPRPRWRRVLGSTWFHLFAAFVVVGALLSFVAKPYSVPSGSMEQTLQIGDRVLVNRLAFVGAEPATGDVVVFDADETWGVHPTDEGNPLKAVLRWVGEVSGFGPSGPHTLVKRVIAGPGQTVECCTADGSLIVDGKPLDEPYIFENFPFTPGTLDCTTVPASRRCLPAVTVPEDSYLMLGDHRSFSSDSAANCRAANDTGGDPGDSCWRWAHRSGIVGKAVVILWPIPRWSGL
ncbi:signal peptidase I [Microbacterium resistens]|uniref:Signal peptidase I n=1 Tax=Microbacterium resistens TaxID=156977 RepID=A0ABU1SCC2_9MICO|nr:signal peptidase I [Microbacterium resistens]MDR6867257.1 signal peptidase I [Microbacterium resistens]